MSNSVTFVGKSKALTLEPLSATHLDAAAELCDQSVGKNLYTRNDLVSVIGMATHSFYVVVTPEQQVVGYIYYFLTDLEEMASRAKLPRKQLARLFRKASPVIGNLCSIGVAQAYQHMGLSVELIQFSLEQLKNNADVAFGVGWKIGKHVPIERTLKACGFRYLTDAHRVWYDNENLVCPYCKGRCNCDAAIYYKHLRKGGLT